MSNHPVVRPHGEIGRRSERLTIARRHLLAQRAKLRDPSVGATAGSMTDETIFPHHTFASDSVNGVYELVSAEIARPISDPQPSDVVPVPQQFRSAGVVEIKLIHGTFAGNDITGLMRILSGVSPTFSSAMMDLGKSWFDQLADENGNFTDEYADLLSKLIDAEGQTQIRVRRFHWSGENHHLGRAFGVVSLLDEIFRGEWSEGDRLLLLAHSHGGNVLAMMSLLLGGSKTAREEFFRAIDGHRKFIAENECLPDWEYVQSNLLDDECLRQLPRMDVVTFGTPLRYRWDTNVCKKLMHVVHHRPLNGDDDAKSELPGSVGDVINAVGGDYVQHMGIAGTDFPHPPLAWEMRKCEHWLQRIFEPNMRRRDLIKHLSYGRRVSLDGKTFLVNYASTPEELNQQLFGHGVYTCREWLPFHLRLIADEFYG